MTKLVWDQTGTRTYETGVERGVLFIPDNTGAYVNGVAWNGLTNISESPSGAEASPQYADNIKYLNLISAEQFSATLEAFTYPDEFAPFDGITTVVPGVHIGQQSRGTFGLCYRTKIGNDVEGEDYGYKLHLVYGCTAAPSEKAYSTQNESPEAIAFSWSISTIPVAYPGLKPTSLVTIDSTTADPDGLAALEAILYGSVGVDPRLPLPFDVAELFDAPATVVPTIPTYVSGTHTLTIPAVTGITYAINGVTVAAGDIVITEDTVVTASPNHGYTFPAVTDDDWFFDYV